MSIRVLLADGHRLMRVGLRSTLAVDAEINVIGEAGDAHEAVHRAEELQPDVVLLDMHLPGGNGLGVARLVSQSGAVRVLLMNERDDAVSVREVLSAGCAGLLRKDLTEQELLDAVRCVFAGRIYLDAEMARQLTQPAPAAPQPCPLDRLSPRERDVFLLIAAGHTNRSAGQELGLSPKTVEKHRAAVMTKLRLQSALELRLMALDLGLAGRASLPKGGEAGAVHKPNGRMPGGEQPGPTPGPQQR
ncbi:response regulator transcription factor [Azohydromonas lata]|uniref:Response regulator transcription factor n=1 Tax=Azohydromonas lata TaxID=45677 RepID=A0ABU5IEA9_9BURK|nr:response regulator transcription factor [Azohydromonas lata]MDZ5457442.1 response regulator transcription factor [Azohydromonas lata]